jgi:hypothetical protein
MLGKHAGLHQTYSSSMKDALCTPSRRIGSHDCGKQFSVVSEPTPRSGACLSRLIGERVNYMIISRVDLSVHYAESLRASSATI